MKFQCMIRIGQEGSEYFEDHGNVPKPVVCTVPVLFHFWGRAVSCILMLHEKGQLIVFLITNTIQL